MTKEQFITLLQSPATINLNLIKGLEEITERFPYFQNAHLLLAKQYQGHQNIRYESYLRKAAAYASDRKVLYELINMEPGKVIHMERQEEVPVETKLNDAVISETKFTREPEIVSEKIIHQEIVPEKITQDELVTEKISATENIIENNIPEEIKNENVTEDIHQEEIIHEWPEDKNLVAEPTEEIAETTISRSSINDHPAKETHLHDALKNDEAENEITKEEVQEIPAEAKIITPQQPYEEVQEKPVEENIIVHQKPEESIPSPQEKTAPDPKEIIAQRLRELEARTTPVEKTVETEKPEVEEESEIPISQVSVEEPEIIADEPETEEPLFTRIRKEEREPRQPRDPELRVVEQHSFLEWLKIKDLPVIPAENVSEYFNREELNIPETDKRGDRLIDQFIKTEPRIVAARSEFYSPGNMARQSAIDHEDLISETLARIYAQQGNIPKAIDAYNRLSLKMPEKSSYFAALIKELENQQPS